MWDPHAGRIDVERAEELLDMSDFEKLVVRNSAIIDLLLQNTEITEMDIQIAYEQRLKVRIREVRDDLSSLVGDVSETQG